MDFQYYTPTRVVFGRKSEEQVGALVRAQGCKKALVHFGGGSARRSGLLETVERSLAAAGVEFTELGAPSRTRAWALCARGWSCAAPRGWTLSWRWAAAA